ncbi:MAG: hypothetical protein ACTHJ4_07855 [Candidatus Nucleicultricaceae bacterium]
MPHPQSFIQKSVVSLITIFSFCLTPYLSASDRCDEDIYGKKISSTTAKRTIFRELGQTFPECTGTLKKIAESLDWVAELTEEQPVYANLTYSYIYQDLGNILFDRGTAFLAALKQPAATVQSLKIASGSHFTDSNYDIEAFDGQKVYLKTLLGTFPYPVPALIESFYFNPALHYLKIALTHIENSNQSLKDKIRVVEESFALIYPERFSKKRKK